MLMSYSMPEFFPFQIYRKTYGSITDFKIFMDAILLSLARKVSLALINGDSISYF